MDEIEMESSGDCSVMIGKVGDGGVVNIHFPTPTFEFAINQVIPVSTNTPPNPMHYLSKGIGFYGRDDECLWMDKFCQLDEQIRYAVVFGVGGVGKSKFMYEYMKNRMASDWHMCFATENIITSLLSFPTYNYPDNLLLVIDYASRYAEIVGKWLAKLSSTNAASKKIRVVLIERQGQSTALVPWIIKSHRALVWVAPARQRNIYTATL